MDKHSDYLKILADAAAAAEAAAEGFPGGFQPVPLSDSEDFGEPWIANAPGDVWHGRGPGGHIATFDAWAVRDGLDERAVACVNACEGIPTESLRRGSVKKLLTVCRDIDTVLTEGISVSEQDHHGLCVALHPFQEKE